MKNLKSAGYSDTPLAKKLGITAGMRVRLVNQPDHYFGLIEIEPEELRIIDNTEPIDIAHLFVQNMNSLATLLPMLRNQIVKNGMIWVSWPKKSSRVPTDVDENEIRDLALEIGLVDVKVCAIDETWSGLKLVYRLKDRG